MLAWSKKPQLWKSNNRGLPVAPQGNCVYLIKGRGHGHYGYLSVAKSNQLIGGILSTSLGAALSASRLSFRAALRDLLLYVQ
jgi:hypothetical protein